MPELEDSIRMESSAPSAPLGGVRRHLLGESVQGRPLEYAVFADASSNGAASNNTTVILAGVHGDETQTVYIARSLMTLLAENPDMFSPTGQLAGTRVIIMPMVNPDGVVARLRRNAHRVDLNRNFPAENWAPSRNRNRYYGGPEPASEPETQAVMRLIEDYRPTKLIALHCISHGNECNNFDGPAEQLAEILSRHNGYPVEPSIGYATPGSLGSWAGIERNVPTVTLECPANRSREKCWQTNRDALLAAIAFRPDRPHDVSPAE